MPERRTAREIDNEALAEFEDRQTMRYVRFYPVEVARVWKAATRSEFLNVWLYPVTRVEPKLGGHCSFTWGRPDDPTAVGEVSRFEPLKAVRYQLGPHNYIEIELEPLEGGTRFTFTQYFGPEFRHPDEGEIEGPDAATPAGPGTPWRPGFLAGFHLDFRAFADFLAENWSDARVATESERRVEIAEAGRIDEIKTGTRDEYLRLVDAYTEHVARTYPRA